MAPANFNDFLVNLPMALKQKSIAFLSATGCLPQDPIVLRPYITVSLPLSVLYYIYNRKNLQNIFLVTAFVNKKDSGFLYPPSFYFC